MIKCNIYVGSHPDDIELGCGGSLAHFAAKKYFNICVVLSNGEKGGDPKLRVKETEKALKYLGASKIFFGKFKDTEITHHHNVILFLEKIAEKYKPEFAFIPSLNEIHQDHRNTALACYPAFRRIPKILAYEAPTTTQFFAPTYYISTENYFEKKRMSINFHKTQKLRSYTQYEAMLNLASYRGSQVGVSMAEAFEVFRYLEN